MQTFGPYVVERELARGGQGVVLRARGGDGHLVALKVLLDPHDDVAVRRFEREARTLSALSHPSLVRVVEHGVHDDRPYLAMELVEGEDLATRLARGGPPPPTWTARTLAAVARGLEVCHARGIVHRDVKPQNVLVERGTERPVLVDFGLARRDPNRTSLGAASVRLSLSGEAMGTPSFMPPEQADGGAAFGPVGGAADVYALGATLYALLTGEPPFTGSSAIEVLSNVLLQAPKPPRVLVPTIPRELDALCLRALAKRPGDRPTIAAFAGALEAFAASAAKPPRTSRRVPAIVAAAGLVGCLLLAGGLVTRGRARGTPVPVPASPSPSPATPGPALEPGWRRVWRRGDPGAAAAAAGLWLDADTAAPLASVARGDAGALQAAFAGPLELRGDRVAVRYGASALRARMEPGNFLTTPSSVRGPVVTGVEDVVALDAPNDTGAVAVRSAALAGPRLVSGCARVRSRPSTSAISSFALWLPNGRQMWLTLSKRRGLLETSGPWLPRHAPASFALTKELVPLVFAPWAPPGQRVLVAGQTVAPLDPPEEWDPPTGDVAVELVVGEANLELDELEVEGVPRRVDLPALTRLGGHDRSASARVAGAFEREASASAGPVLALGEASVELAGTRLLLRNGAEVLAASSVAAPSAAAGWIALERRPGLLRATAEVGGAKAVVEAPDVFGEPGPPGWGSSGPRVRWTDVEVARGPEGASPPAIESWRLAARSLARLTCPRRCDPHLAGDFDERVALAARAATALEGAAPALDSTLRVDARARALLAWVLAGDGAAALRVLASLRESRGIDVAAALDGLARDATGAPRLLLMLAQGWCPTLRQDGSVRRAALEVAWEVALERRGEVALNLAIDAREAHQPEKALESFTRARATGAPADRVFSGEASCFEALRRFDEAARAYGAAIAVNPKNYYDWFGLARAHAALGRLDDAIEAAIGAVATGQSQPGPRAMLEELVRTAPPSAVALVARRLLGHAELTADAVRLRPTTRERDADLLAYVLGEAPPAGDRPTRLLALARAGDVEARGALALYTGTDALVRHVAALDPALRGP